MRPIVLFALTAAACGQTTSVPSVAQFSQAAQNLQALSSQYCAAAAPSTRSECESALTGYMNQALPLANQLQADSPDMDTCMQDMHHGTDADMTAACDAVAAELTRYQQQACSDDVTAMAAEEGQHCSAMDVDLDHVVGRAQELSGMMGSGGMMANGACDP